jgi:hypothetical protein
MNELYPKTATFMDTLFAKTFLDIPGWVDAEKFKSAHMKVLQNIILGREADKGMNERHQIYLTPDFLTPFVSHHFDSDYSSCDHGYSGLHVDLPGDVLKELGR